MKFRIVKTAITVLAAFVLMIAVCLLLNAAAPAISGKETTLSEYGGEIMTFATLPQNEQTGYSETEIHFRGAVPEMMLLYRGNYPSTVMLNGKAVPLTNEYDVGVGICGVEIPTEDLVREDDGYKLTVSVEGGVDLSHFSFFLCGSRQAAELSKFSQSSVALITGTFILMTIYAFTLYCFKRSEKYLLFFAMYTGALSLWFLPSTFTVHSPMLLWTAKHVYNFAVLQSIFMCALLSEIQLKKPFDCVYQWRGAVAVGIVAAVLLAKLGLPLVISNLIQFGMYMLEILILAYSCAKGKRSFWILLLGLLFSQAVRLVAIQPHYGPIHVSIVWLLVKYLRLGIFVFALCCMVFTNRLFARKYQEAETLARELDAKVQQRTAELVRQQQEQRNMVTNISHDLRTPLFVMKGCLERMREKSGQPEILEIAEDRLAFITRLVDNLFTASKLDDHKLLMETEPFDLSAALKGVVTGLALESEDHGIEMQSEIEPDIMAWGDENRLASALQNVIANAVAYTPQGGRIEVRLKDEAGKAVVTVCDNGPGIAPEDLERIFERYYIANHQEHRFSNGLGLSIAREIVRLHRGDIQAFSRVGEGTEFRVTLPRWKRREQA